MADAPTVVIIGGGVTGLACAHRLQELVGADGVAARVILLEAAPRLGGKIISVRDRDFIVDGAADVFGGWKPGARELCLRLGLGPELITTDPLRRRTYVRESDGLQPASHYGDDDLFTLRGGMQVLPDALAAALMGVDVRIGIAVVGLRRGGDSYVVSTRDGDIRADAVVLAVPGPQAALLLRGVCPDAATLVGDVRYRSATTISVAYKQDDCPSELDGYGYMVSGAGGGEVSACTWTSSKIPGRAPRAHVLLRCYLNAGPELPRAVAQDLAFAELSRTLGIRARPLLVRDFVWPDGLPVHPPEERWRAGAIGAALASLRGVFLAGGAVSGVGIPDAVTSGQAAAVAVQQHLMNAWAGDAVH